jgi:alpha-beta hydrolase superfamily lysophospholipase
LRSYPALRHEILNEPEKSAVLQDIFEWLRARQKGRVG